MRLCKPSNDLHPLPLSSHFCYSAPDLCTSGPNGCVMPSTRLCDSDLLERTLTMTMFVPSDAAQRIHARKCTRSVPLVLPAASSTPHTITSAVPTCRRERFRTVRDLCLSPLSRPASPESNSEPLRHSCNPHPQQAPECCATRLSGTAKTGRTHAGWTTRASSTSHFAQPARRVLRENCSLVRSVALSHRSLVGASAGGPCKQQLGVQARSSCRGTPQRRW